MGIFPAPQCTWALSLPCLFVCHQLGVAGEGQGALLGLSWQCGVDGFCVWLPWEAELAVLPGACPAAHPCGPAPCPPGSHPAAADLGKHRERFNPSQALLGFSDFSCSRPSVPKSGCWQVKGGGYIDLPFCFILFCLIFRRECAHFWTDFAFESCDLSGTLQPGARGGPSAAAAVCLCWVLGCGAAGAGLDVSHLFAGWEEYLWEWLLWKPGRWSSAFPLIPQTWTRRPRWVGHVPLALFVLCQCPRVGGIPSFPQMFLGAGTVPGSAGTVPALLCDHSCRDTSPALRGQAGIRAHEM